MLHIINWNGFCLSNVWKIYENHLINSIFMNERIKLGLMVALFHYELYGSLVILPLPFMERKQGWMPWTEHHQHGMQNVNIFGLVYVYYTFAWLQSLHHLLLPKFLSFIHIILLFDSSFSCPSLVGCNREWCGRYTGRISYINFFTLLFLVHFHGTMEQ